MRRSFPLAAQKILLRKIVAGLDNEGSNKALSDAGYCPVSDNTISRYRQSKWVKEQMRSQLGEAVQAGVLDRVRRLKELGMIARDIILRINGRVAGYDDIQVSVPIDQVLMGVKALMPVLAEIRVLQKPFYDAMDAKQYPKGFGKSAGVEQNVLAASQETQSVSKGVLVALLADALREVVDEQGWDEE